MADTFFAGICGRNSGPKRPCRLAWSSSYANNVGTYPSEFLPSRRTIWHAAMGGGQSFTPPLTDSGFTSGLGGIGGLIIGGLSGSGLFGSDISFDNFSPQSHIALIFAKTDNRLNVTHVITEEEMATVNDRGIGIIDVGEYIFEAVAVLIATEDIDIELTDAEKAEIEGTDETESDRSFRKLFDIKFEGENKLKGIVPNSVGIEYRLDNGGPKSFAIFNMSGLGDMHNVNYRDGTSRKLSVKFTEGEEAADTDLQAGDVVFLTYVAVKEHYIRQFINVTWNFFAIDIPPSCSPLNPYLRAVNYRFYEWSVNTDEGEPSALVGGWRAVESFAVPTNAIALIDGEEETELGIFLPNGAKREQNVQYMPTTLTPDVIESIVQNKFAFPRYKANINQTMDNVGYRSVSPDDYKLSADWFINRTATIRSTYLGTNRSVIQHLYFNMHPKALQTRDVDKFGISRFLAESVAKDINSGLFTFFPFLDNAYRMEAVDDTWSPQGDSSAFFSSVTDNNGSWDGSRGNYDFFNNQWFLKGWAEEPFPNVTPVNSSGIYESLDSSNTLFEPIQPVTTWTSTNADMQCGVGGSSLLGDFGGFGDVLSEYQIESPIITEEFAEGTRVLVERHFTANQGPDKLIAIEGLGGVERAVSATHNPQRDEASVVHIDSNGFLTSNRFYDKTVLRDVGNAEYRTDVGFPPVNDNSNPTINQFSPILGYSGMFGDFLGYFPGQSITCSHFSPADVFRYRTSDAQVVQAIMPSVLDENIIEDLVPEIIDNKLVIDLSDGYYGQTFIAYKYEGESSLSHLILKSGETVVGVADSFNISPRDDLLMVEHKWVNCTKIELPLLDGIIIGNVIVVELKREFADDFLKEEISSSLADKNENIFDRHGHRSVLFESSIMSICTDKTSRLFVFFADKDGGISCTQSDDNGKIWYYHYGIIQSLNGLPATAPFVISNIRDNSVYIFYLYKEKILCKKLFFADFLLEDAMIIERFEDDIFTPSTETTIAVESASLYNDRGRRIRYRENSYAAAGDLNDDEFLHMTGRNFTTSTFEPLEDREIHYRDGTINAARVKSNPFSIGPMTAFPNHLIDSVHFSVYRLDNGEMRLFFLAPTAGAEGEQLQCHFSTDDGVTWYDLWEYIEFKYNRFRYDVDRLTQFIDQNSSGLIPIAAGTRATDPQESNQEAPFGLNIHWSRMKRHKTDEGSQSVDDESQVIDIDSPFLYLQPTTKSAFVFYVYHNCLLCKIISDKMFNNLSQTVGSLGEKQASMASVKHLIEKRTKSYFVDGNLTDADIREEVHRYYNVDTDETMADGNIIFIHQATISGGGRVIDLFDSTRTIPVQRVSAYELPNGMVRVMYEDTNRRLKAALWNGTTWYQEELFVDPKGLTPLARVLFANPVGTLVAGGFGDTGFGPVDLNGPKC